MNAEEQKLPHLRKLAADSFREIDRGQGLTVSSESGLRSAIAEIGRRAATVSKQREAER